MSLTFAFMFSGLDELLTDEHGQGRSNQNRESGIDRVGVVFHLCLPKSIPQPRLLIVPSNDKMSGDRFAIDASTSFVRTAFTRSSISLRIWPSSRALLVAIVISLPMVRQMLYWNCWLQSESLETLTLLAPSDFARSKL